MNAERQPTTTAGAAPGTTNSDGDELPVYAFGLELTGLRRLPASPEPPRAGPRRAVALRLASPDAIRERWQPQDPRRIVERRLPDGSLGLAVDEDARAGYRIEAPEVGVHLVNVGGTEVLLPEPSGPDWFWQRLLFAQTLPVAATLQGLGLFHASGVRLGGHAVGVSAPSGTGKSSTATHLIAQGAEFFTDDVLAMDLIDGEVVTFAGPEFSGIEAHEVSAVEPARRENLGALVGVSSKQHRRPRLSHTTLPLGVLYLLERDADVDRVRVDVLESGGIAALLASAFIPHLATDSRLIGHLELCGHMATTGRIYRVRAPVSGSAAAVAEVLFDHARRLLQ